MSLDDRLRPLVRDLFEAMGKSATLRREDQGTFDPGTGTYTGGGTTDHDVTVSPPEGFRQENIDGTLVQASDLQTSIPAKGLPIAPTTGTESLTDTLLVDGTEYQIVRVTPVYSGEQLAMFTLQVRV